MAHAKAHIGTTNFATTVSMGERSLLVDEPVALGGQNAGASPYDLLLAALGSCTAITLRMYAERKGWDLTAVDVDLRHSKPGDRSEISRKIAVTGSLSEEQRARLAEIAERTPVTMTLKSGADITTVLV